MDKIPCDPSIGTDTEWFLFDKKAKMIVPACGMVGGTKEEPLGIGPGFFIQEDNVMVEWNTPPATRWDSFCHYVNEAIDAVYDHVRDTCGTDYTVRCRVEHEFLPEQLVSDQAKTFGCEPDFDAYLGGVQRQDGAMRVLGNTRTCGGHIHIGGDFQCPDFVAALFCELFLGLWGRLPMNFTSTRQKWYGQPGIFRSKPYGIEYRTPDSSWTSDTSYIEYVGLYGMKCAEHLTNTPAEVLQKQFRSYPWVELRKYMSGERNDNRRRWLIDAATQVGIAV